MKCLWPVGLDGNGVQQLCQRERAVGWSGRSQTCSQHSLAWNDLSRAMSQDKQKKKLRLLKDKQQANVLQARAARPGKEQQGEKNAVR